MATALKIDVGAAHIVKGNCKIPQQCMIALAIKEYDPTISYVSVRTNGITVTRRSKHGAVRQHWSVPTKAAKAIIKFDAGETVRPFSFASKLIDEVWLKPVDPKAQKANAEQTKKRRAALAAAGQPVPKYGRQARVAGV